MSAAQGSGVEAGGENKGAEGENKGAGGENKGRRWSLAYLDVTEPPADLAQKYGAVITELDLSYNRISDLRFLSEFPKITTLVLDHNQITSHVKLPDLPHLHTLWVNHNRIKNLGVFVAMLATHCPNLRHLSMMNNEAAPSFFNGGTYQQYLDFRYYVVSRMPKIEVLDYKAVSPEERDEAMRIYGTAVKKRKKKQQASMEKLDDAP